MPPEPEPQRDLLAEQMRALQNMQGQGNQFGNAAFQSMLEGGGLFPGQVIPIQRPGNSMFGNLLGGFGHGW